MSRSLKLRLLPSAAIVVDGDVAPYVELLESENFRHFKFIDGGRPAWALPRSMAGKQATLRLSEVAETLRNAGAKVAVPKAEEPELNEELFHQCGMHEVEHQPFEAPKPTDDAPSLADYDLILINSSGGKDSHAMVAYLASLATPEVKKRMLVAHNNLGRAEWPGTEEVTRGQAEHFGLSYVVVPTRERGDLLSEIEFESGRFPSSNARFCTSDQKTSQTQKLITSLVEAAELNRPMRILYCLGLRAEESARRRLDTQFRRHTQRSNGVKAVDRWLPIQKWSLEQVWQQIDAAGGPVHPAYDLGNERASCANCFLGSIADLRNSIDHNRQLAIEYAGVEQRRGHTLKPNLSITQLALEQGITQEEIDAAPVPSPPAHMIGKLPRADRVQTNELSIADTLF